MSCANYKLIDDKRQTKYIIKETEDLYFEGNLFHSCGTNAPNSINPIYAGSCIKCTNEF